MPSGQTLAIIAIIAMFVVVDLIVVRMVLRNGWGSLADRFQGRPVRPEAVRREFQSFRFGMYKFGQSVHVAVDEEHLHLFPAAVLRWAGARPASIPWERIVLEKEGGRRCTVRIGDTVVQGPAWCLAMATRPA